MIVDDITIIIKAGKGGDGCVSYRREKYVAKGGPDGGNGGRGANVYLLTVANITALNPLKSKKVLYAHDGEPGRSKKRQGANGKDLIIPVPSGTLVTDLDTKEKIEMNQAGVKILAARGGKGGRGNWEFRSATNQTPRFAEEGRPGSKRKIQLNLRFIADIGLVGLPNAGKSSLLNALCGSQVKVADYPFTTTEPNLGSAHGIIIADIPGLIQGAHRGKGLGDKFLKHITKTKLLLHCIDSSSQNHLKNYLTIGKEIKSFDSKLADKPEIIILTKTDLIEKKQLEKIKFNLKKTKREIFAVSVLEDNKIKALEMLLHKKIKA